jgi:hypothetical protein
MKRAVIIVTMLFITFHALMSLGLQCKPHEFYDGYSALSGWTIGSPYDEKPIYSIDYTCKNDICDRFYLSRLLYNDDSGCAHHKTVSHIVIPQLREGETYALGCSVNGKPDPEVVVYAKRTDKEFHTEITHAWRANRRLEKFEKISPKGIKCVNEGFGV